MNRVYVLAVQLLMNKKLWDIDNKVLWFVKTMLCAVIFAVTQSNTALRFLTLCCAFYSVCDVVVVCLIAAIVCVVFDVIV